MRARLLLTVALAVACSSKSVTQPSPLDGPEPTTFPRYGEVWGIATHNAYWVDRATPNDSFASGTETRLLDQLLRDGARSIEIDVHRDESKPGKFRVYHTVPGNSLCDALDDCLALVRAFHWALPQHEPLQIVIELKELFSSNFDPTHTIEDLDRSLRDGLGATLYAPSDFAKRCQPSETLSTCVARKKWPGIDTLRGRVIVSMLGNWDELGKAQATADWAHYAVDVRARAAFPMASSWKLDASTFTPRMQENVSQAELDRALSESIFLQIEDTTDARIAPFLKANGIIRVGNAYTIDEQKARLSLGMQLLQTDFPWVQHDPRGLAQPLRAFDAKVDRSKTTEPGHRLLLSGPKVFAHVGTTGVASLDAAIVSGGGDHDRIGCLRADFGSDADKVSFCRTRSLPKKTPDTERLELRIEECHASACTTRTFRSLEPKVGGAGDLLSIELDREGGCMHMRSANGAGPTVIPNWVTLADVCFAGTPTRIGLERPADSGTEPTLFAGARTINGTTETWVEAKALTMEDRTKLEDATAP